MAKIFKISGYLVDPVGDHTLEDVKDFINGSLYAVLMNIVTRHLHLQERDIGKWDENLPISQKNCDLYECEKYFKGGDGWPVDTDRKVTVGQKYRHFKGKIVEVLAISQDTEMPGQFIVVYIDRDNYVWHLPLGMFLSEVDHEKYPLVKQKYRFELIEEG